ncbi:MAG: urease accessory protein UreD [Chloroflexales bacterium]|nr:urease accessory protein UreD [Chloroflexales bacterium]
MSATTDANRVTERASIAHGRGTLDLALEHVGSATRPRRCLAQAPLQLSRVRYDDSARPEQAHLTIIQLGGILSGDRYDLRVELGSAAAAQITTAAATQVYCMPHGEAEQHLSLRLAAGSRLAWLPEPLILFAGSRFRQTIRIELGPNARLDLLDVLVPGRLARGEAFQFESYTSHLEIVDSAGTCLAAEHARLAPRRYALDVPGVFGATPVLGSLYVLGDSVDGEAGSAWVARRCDPLLGATTLPNACGLLVRTLGHSAHTVRRTLLEVRQALAAEGQIP